MSVHRQYFPDEEDEKGAAKALMRLQDTYKLDSESFSKGKLPGNRGERAAMSQLVPAVGKPSPGVPRSTFEYRMSWIRGARQMRVQVSQNLLV